MERRHDEVKDTDSTNEVPQERQSHLPIIALAFSAAPLIIGLIYRSANKYTFMLHVHLYGYFFYVVGIIIGIIALYRGEAQIGKCGLILSYIAVFWPFMWWFLIWPLFRSNFSF